MTTTKKPKAPAKKSAAPETEKFPRKNIPCFVTASDSEAEQARKVTELMTGTEMAALRVIKGAESKSGYWESIDVPALMEQLRQQAAAVNRGDLAQAEAMLMNQATALQSLFARLAEHGMGCDHAPAFEANMRMALRAQAQCRATIEALAEIKNPRPVAFVKQANISNGHQQVNNGVAALPAHGNNPLQSNELSGAGNELLPDARASQASSRINTPVEAVGEIHRAEDGGRQGHQRSQ